MVSAINGLVTKNNKLASIESFAMMNAPYLDTHMVALTLVPERSGFKKIAN